MIEEVVTVSRIDQHEIWVEASRQSACASCSSKQSCGQGKLSDWAAGNTIELAVSNPTGLSPALGQHVVIGLEEGSLVKASLLLYFVPLLMLVVAALSARALGGGEGLQVLAAAVGLGCGFLSIQAFQRRGSMRDGCYQPVLLRLS